MAKPRILLFEKIHRKGMDFLEQQGCEIVFPESIEEKGLIKAAAGVSGIVFRTHGFVSRRLMESSPGIQVVGRHGVGLDNLDIPAATELGIWVVSTPEANSESVAEHFVSLALMLSRKVLQSTRALKAGRWEDRNLYIGQELFGKVLGVVGLGRVGSTIARICHHAFGMKILFRDIVPKPEWEKALSAQPVSLDEVLSLSDYISLNVPLTTETRGMIGSRELGLMRKSAFIINTARGPVWKETELLHILKEGRIAGAAADVFEREPASSENPLLPLENFIGTPHVAAHTQEAMQRMAMVVEDVVAVVRGREPKYPANRPSKLREVSILSS
jgi:D-3-phosphoglycerate dehydrogenase / 2-oxoglutarate reductase